MTDFSVDASAVFDVKFTFVNPLDAASVLSVDVLKSVILWAMLAVHMFYVIIWCMVFRWDRSRDRVITTKNAVSELCSRKKV